MPDPDLGPLNVPRRCWVLVDGAWTRGWLHEWKPASAVLRPDTDGWAGYVRYERAGLQYWHWVHQSELADGEREAPEVGAVGVTEMPPPWLGDEGS